MKILIHRVKRRKRSASRAAGLFGIALLSGVGILTSCGADNAHGTGIESGQETEKQVDGLVTDKGQTAGSQREPSTLVYGSGDYTRINPAMDEHGEINILLFNGLTAHDGDNQVVPSLAKSWEFDPASCTYTFHLEEGVRWHDGQEFQAEDVKFTIEAIMDPENGSENAPNYEDVREITVIDSHTVSFALDAPNVAFLDYMAMPILPKHLLEGEDMQTSDFFRSPVGTGPYELTDWDEGQAITLTKNEDYFKGPAKMIGLSLKS